MAYIDKIKNIYSPEYFTGSSDIELTLKEGELGVAIPLALKEYYMYMGKDYNGIFRGTDCFLRHLKNDVSTLSKLYGWDYNKFPLPESALIFFSHQGYIKAWILLPSQVDDPKVFYYAEGNDENLDCPFINGTFSEFLFRELNWLIKI